LQGFVEPKNKSFLFTQLFFEDLKEPVSGLSFDPGLMRAVFEQDQSKAPQRGRQGFSDSLNRMGIVVAVNRNHRTLDLLSQSQKLPAPSPLGGILPDALIDPQPPLQGSR
jgi:hypothetical protein